MNQYALVFLVFAMALSGAVEARVISTPVKGGQKLTIRNFQCNHSAGNERIKPIVGTLQVTLLRGSTKVEFSHEEKGYDAVPHHTSNFPYPLQPQIKNSKVLKYSAEIRSQFNDGKPEESVHLTSSSLVFRSNPKDTNEDGYEPEVKKITSCGNVSELFAEVRKVSSGLARGIVPRAPKKTALAGLRLPAKITGIFRPKNHQR